MDDATLIDRLGGPTKLAAALGYPVKGGPQRVANWASRGIPPAVKFSRLDLFGPEAVRALESHPAPQQQAA